MKRTLTVMAIVLAACGSVQATTTVPGSTIAPTTIAPAEGPSGAPTTKATGIEAKLASQLAEAARMASEGATLDEIVAKMPELRVDPDGIEVEVTLDAMDDDVRVAAEAAGLHVEGEFPDLRLLTGSISPDRLLDLAALDGVSSVAVAFGATTG